MSEELRDLLDAWLESDALDESTKARLRDVRLCTTPETWWMFIASVSDEDPIPLQHARTLILCSYLLSEEKRGALFAVNSANRGEPTLLYNPNEDEETGLSTEHTAFLENDASLDPGQLRYALEENRDRCRFIRVSADGEPDVYASLHPFEVKNLMMSTPVPSIQYRGIHVVAH